MPSDPAQATSSPAPPPALVALCLHGLPTDLPREILTMRSKSSGSPNPDPNPGMTASGSDSVCSSLLCLWRARVPHVLFLL